MTNEANILSFDEARASVSLRSGRDASLRFSNRPLDTKNRRVPSGQGNGASRRFADTRSKEVDLASGAQRSSTRRARSEERSVERQASRVSTGRHASMGSVGADAFSRRQMGSYSEDAERRREMRSYERSHPEGSRAESRAKRVNPEKDDSVVSELRHKMRSSKADRQFNRTVGKDDARRASQGEQGSRAAVYEMKMGRSHRRSAHMQERSSATRSSSHTFLGGFLDTLMGVNFVRVGAMVLLLFGALAVFVYEPAANWYNETRSLQQLQAQYELTAESYNQMKADVDYLGSDEGMADYAHQQLGWVRSGEHSVTVKGLSSDSKNDATSSSVVQALSQGNVQAKAPDTWYSGILDVVFGYEG